ncbi:hypothetical protein HU200_029475 [Digitaria exilis]|uniref:O-methyltransferase n=1 Tax=Digitaria exilis TaxID=1010633 RepID=A0A835BZ96_9POAL|nr:hypothetical protein HU200_029475 [Digitaria exilis]
MGSIQEQHTCAGRQAQAMLDAQLDLWHNTFAFIKSMAFKCALELRIADAIHNHGGTATLTQIASQAKIHPSKIPCLCRLMRVLTVTGIFSIDKNPTEEGDRVYGLTPASRLLAGPQNLAPTLKLILHSTFVSPFLGLGTWLEHKLPDWVMHDWGDSDCVTILKNCKKAIPPGDAGGKVIIVDAVIGAGSSTLKHRETHVLYDLFIMVANGTERDEREWRKIIIEAGFTDYKIIPVLGVRSIIEVYP